MIFTTELASRICGHANTQSRRQLGVDVATKTFERFGRLDFAQQQASKAVFRKVIKDTARRAQPVQMRLF